MTPKIIPAKAHPIAEEAGCAWPLHFNENERIATMTEESMGCLSKKLEHLAERPAMEQELLNEVAEKDKKIADAQAKEAVQKALQGKIPVLKAALWVVLGVLGGTAAGYIMGTQCKGS